MEEAQRKSVPELIEDLLDLVRFQLWRHRFDRCIQELKQIQQERKSLSVISETTSTPQEQAYDSIDSKGCEESHVEDSKLLGKCTDLLNNPHRLLWFADCRFVWTCDAKIDANSEENLHFDFLELKGKMNQLRVKLFKFLRFLQYGGSLVAMKGTIINSSGNNMLYCTKVNVEFKEWKGGTNAWTSKLSFTRNTGKFPILGVTGKLCLVEEVRVLKLNFLDVGSFQLAIEIFFGTVEGQPGEGRIIVLVVSTPTSIVFISVKSRGLAVYTMQRQIQRSIGLVFLGVGYRYGYPLNHHVIGVELSKVVVLSVTGNWLVVQLREQDLSWNEFVDQIYQDQIGDSDTSTSEQKSGTMKYESNLVVKYSVLKQVNHMLGGIHALSSLVLEFPIKDAAHRLYVAQASSSMRVTAGLTGIINMTLGGNGMDWSFNKNGVVNIILSFGLPRGDFNRPITNFFLDKSGSIVPTEAQNTCLQTCW